MGWTQCFLAFFLVWISAFLVLGEPTLTCANVLCMVGTICVMINDEPQCVSSSEATCWAWGDPHYHTFDGRDYDFQGTCVYTVVKTCGYTSGLPAFHIFARNENRGNKHVSYVGMVTVQVYGRTITMIRSECHFVRVDGIRTSLPISLYHGMLQLSQSGTFITLATNFHLRVLYDCSHQLHVTINSVYHGAVCGLCGNYNGDPTDDFLTPAGTVAPSAIAFGESWSLRSGSESCWHDCHGACQPCPHSLAKKYETEFYCGLITANGSFAQCHSKVNPTTFFENCIHDLCFTGGHHQSLCNSLKAYADACQRDGVQIGEWRTWAQCPLECPPNSQYQLCGTACPATCMNAQADIPCPDVCVEGCQCREGFVLSQGKCIPKSSCGCLYKGRLYAINETFWVGDNCKTRCMCTAVKKVKCVICACKASERCRVVNGVQGCYPRIYGVCHASGGLHYLTFDKHKFDFQGDCTYVLTEVCRKPPGLEGFSIYVQSKRHESHIVSVNWSVQVNVLSYVLAASFQHPGRILVNGLLTYLPYSTVGGRLNVFRKGCHLVIQTDFGLTVLFDWENLITVTVPGTYAGTLCGLCGNFNGNRADDAPVSGSFHAPSKPAFGNGSKISASNCSEIIDPQCPGLKALAEQQRSSGQDCGLILAKDGPFRECHCHVDKEAYFQDCIYNYCHFQRQHAFVCAGIASYATACQAAEVAIYSWRSSHFCPPSCAPNSHYELCSRDCSQTCSSLYVSTPCLPACKESCVCDEGFAMSDTQCVPVAQCGCFYKGRYYPVGGNFYPDCHARCVCQAGGYVSCLASPCGPQEECRVVDGTQKCQKCYPIQNATCYAAEDGHYLSFDGLPFDFRGTCTYILAKTHRTKSNGIPFTVIIQNEVAVNGKDLAIKLVSVEIYGVVLTLLQKERGVIQVNGRFQSFPMNLSNGQLQVYQHREMVMVETTFGLTVSYDLVSRARVTVPRIYQGQMGGLCGNYNEWMDDEFQLPDGNLASDVVTFGAAWKILIAGVSCMDGCFENYCYVYKERSEVFKQRNFCGLLTACDGPFRACHSVVNPGVYLSDCIFDMTWRDWDHHNLCQNIESYMIACQEAKVSIQPWRSLSFCPTHCPANSHYAICPDVYNTTCAGIRDHIQYPEACTEGCQCDGGFFSDGLQCISANACGCLRGGQYFPPNATTLLKNCTERCTCSPAQGFICVPHACLASEACGVKDGAMQCYREDPCKATVCRPKETCQVEDGQPTCVSQYMGNCWVWGGLHYHTFDGYDYNLHGNCSYVLVQSKGDTRGLEPFSVEEKNENRGRSTARRQIVIHVYEHKITISKGEHGRVRVNDILCNLPAILAGGLVSISWRSNSTIVQTKYGLAVMFHWNWHVQVMLPSSYYNTTGGLCGNFNQLKEDEWVDPDGTLLPTLSDWVDAWVVKDGSPQCVHQCQGECQACEGPDRLEGNHVEQCGVISAPDGPFQGCHSMLDPKTFLQNCAYDVCMNGADHAIFCQAVSSYAHTCHHEGQPVRDWRIPIDCSLSCPVNSHYEACGSACPATCSDRTAPSSCKQPCVETCQCNEGFILSVDKCVPIGSCGCTYKGLYYETGEEFWDGKDCDSLCKCDASQGTVVCHPRHCKACEECTVVNGVRGCHIIRPSTCTATGDYSYTTFDGQRYSFNGTCVYQLAGVCSANSTLAPFSISIQNSPPPDGHVVICSAHGVSITLHAGTWDKIKLNDTEVDLPFSLEQKIHVAAYGSHVAIMLDTGLSIIVLKENLTVMVTVPGNYMGHLCGLCGNANGDSSDDQTGEFGEQWRVGCSPGCSSDCPSCSLAEQESYQEDVHCGLLLKKSGPFEACQRAIPSKPFFVDCMRKTCRVRGREPTWCDVITSYVAICQAKDFLLKKWRTDAFCSLACPAHSHYELCGSQCPATCDDPSGSIACTTVCLEGCICDAGFVLKEDHCVPIQECACEHQGKYYRKGKEFFTNDTCRERCQCHENGTVQCHDDVCSGANSCKVVRGRPVCFPREHSTCYVLDNHHYITFDGLHYSLPASCSYILAQSDGPHGFSIVVVAGSDGIGEVRIQVSEYQVTLLRGRHWEAWVNGELVHLPVALVDVWVHQEGRAAVLWTLFGLHVYYDLENWVAVSVSGSYRGRLEGLCGNCNGNKSDEFLMPNGEQAHDAVAFGASWKVNGGNCLDECGKNCHVCDKDKGQIYQADNYCGMIQANHGPFSACHSMVDPAQFFSYCLVHMCAAAGTQESLCQSLQAYAAACHVAGATVEPWRNSTFCPLKCMPGTYYDSCAWTCNSTCATELPCTRPCFESCSCDKGTLANGATCVDAKECGCWHNGRLIKQGQSILTPDCAMNYTCQRPGLVISKPHSCADANVCGLRNGLRGCFPTVGHCRLKAGPWFSSFDGLSGKVPALGTYELASLCDRESGDWFRILVRVASCPPNGTVIATVLYVFFKGAFIVVRGQKEAWMNGLPVQIPSKVHESVTLDLTSQGITLRLPQVEVNLNLEGGAVVTVSVALAGKVCGACGNLNHKRTDDLVGPGGVELKSVKELLASWRARDFAHCVG